MIGRLFGKPHYVVDDHCIIDVAGVGYLVFISQKTANVLRDSSQALPLLILTVVKDDAIELYGFLSAEEKSWFAELNKVQGVGAKMAQKILSSLSIGEIAMALIAGDSKLFTTISGIGNKLATRIINELKDSPNKLSYRLENNQQSTIKIENAVNKDALSALENLGYRKNDCLNIINDICKNNPQITLEQLITMSLRELAKK